MGYIKEEDLTKHVCQLRKLSLQMGSLPNFQLSCLPVGEKISHQLAGMIAGIVTHVQVKVHCRSNYHKVLAVTCG